MNCMLVKSNSSSSSSKIFLHSPNYESDFYEESIPGSTKSNSSELKQTNDDGNPEERQVQPTCIKSLNPYHFYVTKDGLLFPMSTESHFSPFQLLNLANKYTKAIYDKATRQLSFTLTPKFDATDVVPWQFIRDKLMYSGHRDLHDLALSFENFIESREELTKKKDMQSNFHSPTTELKPLTKIKLSDTIPQFADIRILNIEEHAHKCISKLILNKPMQNLLGVDNFCTLHKGFKDLFDNEVATNEDSIKFTKKFLDTFKEWSLEEPKPCYSEKSLKSMTIVTPNGKLVNVDIKLKYFAFSDASVLVSSYCPRELKAIPISINSISASDISNESSKELTPYYKGELDEKQQKLQHALDYRKRFDEQISIKKKKNAYEPPYNRICRIKNIF